MDLFEHYQEQPPELKAICDKWSDKEASEGLDYNDCKTFLNEVEAIGYTFDYYLDAEPYNLRKKDDFLDGILQSDFTQEDKDEFNKPF